MGSDLFESYCGSIIGAITLALSDKHAGCAPCEIGDDEMEGCAEINGEWVGGVCNFYAKQASA